MLRGSVGLVVVFVLAYWALPWAVQLPETLSQPVPQGLEITDRHGKSLRRLLAEGQRSQGSLKLAEMPQALPQATVAAEDKRFFSHGGIDFLSLGRAVWDALRLQRATSGASTITQQLIKISQPRRKRNLMAKGYEMLAARRLEMTWSKEQILEAYLNRLDYGNLRRGCAIAAQGYFAKPLADCSPAECAFLAGLPQAPTRLNPYQHLDRALKRQRYVLQQMTRTGALTVAEAERAQNEKLLLEKDYGEFLAPHFVDQILQDETISQRTEIRTTLDLPLQLFCEKMIEDRLSRIEGNNVQQGAGVVIHNPTGEVRALVGSRNYAQVKVNGALARRSPGSALKPFTFLLAFQSGESPASIIPDLPIEFSTPTGLYKPKNYSGRAYGPVSYRIALANSLNLAAVRVLDLHGGVEPLIEALQAAGITTLTRAPSDYGLGLTIGGGEVTLFELANAYATLARSGMFRPISLTVTDESQAISEQSLFDPVACYLLADVMADNDARVRSFGSRSPLRLNFPVAVKTGTSTDYRDNWTIGFTPDYTVAVWVGNFDGSAMRGVSGVTGAGPIFRDIFYYLDAHERQRWFDAPETVTTREVDALTGLPVPEMYRERRKPVVEKFHQDRAPVEVPTDRYDTEGRVYVSQQYANWLKSEDNWLGDAVALAPSGHALNAEAAQLRIVVPLSGATYLLDPDLPDQGKYLVLKANAPTAKMDWASDTLALEQHEQEVRAVLVPGQHEIRLTCPETERTVVTKISVKQM
jgi:penicillin-binding protein 1C